MAVRYASCHPDKYHKAKGLCGACWTRQWREANPEKALQISRKCEAKRRGVRKHIGRHAQFNHAWHIQKTFGLSIEEYNVLLKKQQGVCAICEQPERHKGSKRLAVDHDHVTGKIRGLLCSSCNLALGKFKDSVELMLKAISYIKESTYVHG